MSYLFAPSRLSKTREDPDFVEEVTKLKTKETLNLSVDREMDTLKIPI